MGNHLKQIGTFGGFVSDKYTVARTADQSDATVDKLVLSFHDADARSALLLFANTTKDADLARDIKARLRTIEAEIRDQAIRDQGTG